MKQPLIEVANNVGESTSNTGIFYSFSQCITQVYRRRRKEFLSAKQRYHKKFEVKFSQRSAKASSKEPEADIRN